MNKMAAKMQRAVIAELPECPVCMETMTAPIFQCQSGHSLCNSCTQALSPSICPICRQAMTQMRNWQLEDIVHKARVPCTNKPHGCVYTMVAADLDDHLKECIFREMECPLGVVFGKCSWSGKLKEMMDHFKDRHADHCNVTSDNDVEVTNLNIKEDDRRFYLVMQGKIHFIITMKLDTLQKMSYWTVQLIGSKKLAQQHIYEIHVTSNQDARRKVVFTEHCFNDALKADEVFRVGKCAVLPLDVLAHFVKNKVLIFRFFIKRLPTGPNNSAMKEGGKSPNPGSGGGPRGAGPNGPNRPGAHGPKGPGANGPKGPGPNGPKGPNKNAGFKGQGPSHAGPKGPGPNAGPKQGKK